MATRERNSVRVKGLALKDMTLLERMRDEVPQILEISTETLHQRLSTAGMILALLYAVGEVTTVLLVLAGIAFSEVVFLANHRTLRRLKPGQHLSTFRIATNWTASTISTVAFCAPTPVMASLGSVPFIIASLMWLLGVLVHITNTYIDLSVYNRTQVIPVYVLLLGTFAILFSQPDGVVSNGTPLEWGLLLVLTIVHGTNTIQTMAIQGATRHELREAQNNAETRLRALEHLSRHDPLTGLPNRAAFEAEMAALLNSENRTSDHRWPAVMVIDLDGFKPINDSYGHDAGDSVLRHVGARLEDIARDRGFAARIGGDEFALGLKGVTGRQEALEIADAIQRTIQTPIRGSGPELRVGSSIGVALADEYGISVRKIVSRADQAMYRAKTHGSGTHAVRAWDRSIAPRLGLEDRQRLMTALERGEIQPFYQPKVDLSDFRIIGFEALARWVLPDGAVKFPAAFVPQIAELGLHNELLWRIADQVRIDLLRLKGAGLGSGRVSLNVPESALATRSGQTALLDIFRNEPNALRHLTFEITEDVIISRAGSLLEASIGVFRSRGARISLDDFGTGYASFQHLRQLEFDELKIDKSFVAGLCEDETASVLVEGFLSIAKGLDVTVVAEGVETAAQEARLRALGCDLGQGYRYGRAMPIAETEVRLLAQCAAPPSEPVPSRITRPGV